MAPTLRSSQQGRSLPREGSWQVLDENPETIDENSDDPFEEDSNASVRDLGQTSARNMLEPLEQAALRVSKQVESFARKLDLFQSKREDRHEALWEDALDLIETYESITDDRRKEATSARAQSPRRRGQSDAEIEAEIVKTGEETELWQLCRILASANNPDLQAEYAEKQKSPLGLHRYSDDLDVWEAFLSVDVTAKEYADILTWLQRSASSSREDIETMLEDLKAKGERGSGIWNGGWLFTREAIKQQKRNRSLHQPLDRSTGLDRVHVRKADGQRLVTKLDPDSIAREMGRLEVEDEYHEEAAWIACWELLRRGEEDLVREWWSERNESWRSLSTRGLLAQNKTESRLSSLWKADDSWSSACQAICHGQTITPFEAAVYGILAGDAHVPLRVCKTIDDYLFVHINALLIERFRAFGVSVREGTKFKPAPPTSLQMVVHTCQIQEQTRVEGAKPLKNIECGLLYKDWDQFFLDSGRAWAELGQKDEVIGPLVENDGIEASPAAKSTAVDADALRIVVHQQLALKSLGYLRSVYGQWETIVENNVAAYIGWLRQEGKISLIPLYVSNLSIERGARVLGVALTDVLEFEEREHMVRLMKQYRLNVPRALWQQFRYVAEGCGLSDDENPALLPVKVTEYGPLSTAKTKMIRVRPGFMGSEEDLQLSEEELIRCVEWYSYGDKKSWAQTCQAASSLFKCFIGNGRLIAARAMVERAGLSILSKLVIKVDLKRSDSGVNTPDDDSDMDGMDGVVEDDMAIPMSPSRRQHVFRRPSYHEQPGQNQQQLADEALIWRQLEELTEALIAFEEWQVVASRTEKTRGDKSQMRRMKKELEVALREVEKRMDPLLEFNFLASPRNEAEAKTLTQIRNHYIPECILAYNSALHYAGHAITRSKLVECMNLAQTVATNSTLTDAFKASARMKELVTAFALSSQALLQANEQGPVRKGRREPGIEIWQVKPGDVGLVPSDDVRR